MNLAIVTATYNREVLLKRLYNTLCRQTDLGFIWVVIDDGSTDHTMQLIAAFRAEQKIRIDYHKQENGGKARAINRAFSLYPNVDFFVIVDSDDYLLEEGVARIKREVLRFSTHEQVGAIHFRYFQDTRGQQLLGQNVQYSQPCVLGRREHDAKYGKYDGCIGYYQRAAQNYRYPEYPGERYVGPTVLQMMMEPEFKIAFTDIAVGYAEYQKSGLSKTGRKLRLQNPVGMLHYSILQQESPRLSVRIKSAVCAQAYAHLARKQRKLVPVKLDQCLKTYAKIPGIVLGYYWESRYGNW